MTRKMLINATHPEENRVAIVEGGVLTELDIEIAGKEQTKSNIYKATVVRVEQGLQAAFVDYGGERLGFLQVEEIHPSFQRNLEKEGEKKGRPRITDLLHRGQEILVQIVKEERGTKGAALTTYISLPGRYMVLLPDSTTKGVSRKIEDEPVRKKLKEIMKSLDLPEDMGYIVRTAAIGQKNEELKRDFSYLVRLYENIRALEKKAKAPSLIYKESNLVIRSIRDYFTPDMEEVLVDDPKVFEEARDFFREIMPEYARLVKLHQERRPIFARYQIEDQIQTISSNKVPLPSGGSIVIDTTEALVAIDVNSGKMAGEQGIESTATRTNLEAAAEVGRQLRLRDLGGLIVIDFIDMRERKNIREVEKAVKDALQNDKARVTVGRISQFGLLELSRQRIKAALAEGSFLPCPHCDGTGRIKSAEAQAIAFLRKLQAGIAKGNIGIAEGKVPLDVATYLLNKKRAELHDMEHRHDISIHISGSPDFISGQMELTFLKREKEEERAEPEFVSAGTLPPLKEEAPPEETKGAEPPVEAAEETAPEEEGEGKKKRRRNRKKKKKPEEKADVGTPLEETRIESAFPTKEEEASVEEAKEEVLPESAEPEAIEGENPEGGTKKKRRRSRKKHKKGEVPPPEEPVVEIVEEIAPPVQEETLPEISEEPATEPARKKRRRRKKKGGAKPETVPTEAFVEKDTVLEPPPAPEPETVSEAKPKKAPVKRTTAKKKTEKQAPEEVEESVKAEPAKEETPKKAPAKRATTKKKTEKAAPQATEEATKAEPEKEEKPKKTTAKRTTTKKKADKTVPEEPQKAVETEPTKEEKPKKAPAKRPTTKKKAEKPFTEGAEKPVEPEPAKEKKPKKAPA